MADRFPDEHSTTSHDSSERRRSAAALLERPIPTHGTPSGRNQPRDHERPLRPLQPDQHGAQPHRDRELPPLEDTPRRSSPEEVPQPPTDLVSALASVDEPLRPPPTRQPPRPWHRGYVARLVLVDATSAAVGSVSAATAAGTLGAPRHLVLAPLYVVAWVCALAVGRAYDTRLLGVGPADYFRVLRSGVGLFAVVAAGDALLGLSMGSPAVGAVLLTIGLDVGARLLLRRGLYRARWRGRYVERVVAVGTLPAVSHMAALLRREAHHGLEVVGACLLDHARCSADAEQALGVPVFGSLGDVPEAVASTGSQVVAVASSGELARGEIRRLAWSLEGLGTEVLVSPGLEEVAGPRLTVRPYVGLPLLHVEHPRLSGTARIAKGCGDRIGAALLLVLFAPLLVTIAVAVAATSPGGVFFAQTRVGLDGRPFRLWKFRSMVADADSLIDTLDEHNEKDDVLFKMRRDPRVTPVGAILRRLSLDELPQLLNVLGGSMSLVGPRPPLPREVEQYETDVRRRLRVRPGITGLWQVSGRSDLSWEDSVRLDLRYVENWTVGLDVSILWRTASAVVGGRGAY